MVLNVEDVKSYNEQKEEAIIWMQRNKYSATAIKKLRDFCQKIEESNEKFVFSFATKIKHENDVDGFSVQILANFVSVKSPVDVWSFSSEGLNKTRQKMTSAYTNTTRNGKRMAFGMFISYIENQATTFFANPNDTVTGTLRD